MNLQIMQRFYVFPPFTWPWSNSTEATCLVDIRWDDDMCILLHCFCLSYVNPFCVFCNPSYLTLLTLWLRKNWGSKSPDWIKICVISKFYQPWIWIIRLHYWILQSTFSIIPKKRNTHSSVVAWPKLGKQNWKISNWHPLHYIKLAWKTNDRSERE